MKDEDDRNAGGSDGEDNAAAESRGKLSEREQQIANRAEKRERLRREAAERKLAELTAKLDTLDKEKLTEYERREKEAYERGRMEAEEKLKAQTARERKLWKAERALLSKRADPDAAKLIDLDDLAEDDDVAEAVEKLLEAKPHLILQQAEGHPAQGGTPGRKSRAESGGAWTRARIRSVIEAGEYDKYRDEIAKANREGRIVG